MYVHVVKKPNLCLPMTAAAAANLVVLATNLASFAAFSQSLALFCLSQSLKATSCYAYQREERHRDKARLKAVPVTPPWTPHIFSLSCLFLQSLLFSHYTL